MKLKQNKQNQIVHLCAEPDPRLLEEEDRDQREGKTDTTYKQNALPEDTNQMHPISYPILISVGSELISKGRWPGYAKLCKPTTTN